MYALDTLVIGELTGHLVRIFIDGQYSLSVSTEPAKKTTLISKLLFSRAHSAEHTLLRLFCLSK